MISNKISSFLLLILSILSLTSCTIKPEPSPYPTNQYLQRAAQTSGNTQTMYLLKAAHQLLNKQQSARAQTILNQIDNNLPSSLQIKKQLIYAQLLISYHQDAHALHKLQAMNSDRSSWLDEDRIEWHILIAKASQNLGDLNTSVQQLSDMIDLLPQSERKRALLSIWNTLENTAPSRIHPLLLQASTPTVKGWLSLAAIAHQGDLSSQELGQQVQHWKLEYPNHPAMALLYPDTQKSNRLSKDPPKHIALLLPLTGQYAKAGHAISQGFFAAYYQAKQEHPPTPEITIINTDNKNIAKIYQIATHQGADFVVGPLIKNNISTLTQSIPLSIPTLALNTVSNLNDSNLYQFGLLPMDEAQQVAMKAWNSHHYSALVIIPKNHWGESIADTFAKTWHILGGGIVGTLEYTAQTHLFLDIRHLLNIDQAIEDKKILRSLLGERLRYVPRRRKDVDMIFLIATPSIARQIQPILHYFYAGNIPIYSISNVYSGRPKVGFDKDLEGIYFPDMPWVLSTHMKPETLNHIREKVKQLWPQTYNSEPKLIALGVDAYNMIMQLSKMTIMPELGIPAATGTLYLSKNHHIYRKLCWSKINKGFPLSIP